MIFVFCLAVFSSFIACLVFFNAIGRLPFSARFSSALTAADSDKLLLRGQIAELRKMQALDLLDLETAAAAYAELARRIPKTENAYKRAGYPQLPGKIEREEEEGAGRRAAEAKRISVLKLFLSAGILFIPLFSGFIYYLQGQAGAVSRPFSDFMKRAPEVLNLQEKIVRLEALAARNPRSGGEAEELADLYLQAGRFQDAANAYTRAIALNGESAERQLGYALALTGFEDGIINKTAEEAFRKVLQLDSQNHQAQLFLARALLQDGKKAEAVALLQDFLRQTPAESPWRLQLQAVIAALQTPQNSQAEQGSALVAAGAEKEQKRVSMPVSSEQRAFITSHLSRLEAKTEAEPNNVQAWKMLVTAYLLLDREDKAAAAARKGAELMKGRNAETFRAFAAEKGLPAD